MAQGADAPAQPKPAKVDYLRIATEEAWAPPELFTIYRDLLSSGKNDDPGFKSLWGFYAFSDAARPAFIRSRMTDLGALRLSEMDATGIDKQLLLLTGPGVQVMDRDTAVSFAASSNDQLAEAIRRHPTRFTGLAAIAPQAPETAAKEIERAMKTLGLKGVVINSHTNGEFLDDKKFWPILEAAEAASAAIYIHPSGPPRAMIQPYLEAGLDGAIFGFAAETGLHVLRMITAGVFDRFPKLKIVIGHCGEALPFWMFRLDYMHRASVASGRYETMKPLKRKVSDYMRENIWITTSGMAWEPAISFCQKVLGMDRVLYAMDYPYQYDVNEVIATDNLPLSAADKKKLFQTNAERVFGL